MAFINRKRIKPEMVKPICSEAIDSCKFYNSAAWRRLRNFTIQSSPLCYECLQHYKLNTAEHVHHLKRFACGATEEEQWKLFLNPNNLRCLCKKCHEKYHIKMKRYGLDIVDGLTDKEYNEE